MALGESVNIDKTVGTPEIPPLVDVCLLEDETGSFWDDIAHLQGGTTASDIYNAVKAESTGAQFAVAGFRDYPMPPYGWPGDWVYSLHSGMSPIKANWLAGIAALTAGGGNDTPEAQYDAIVAAAIGDDNCGWRDPVSNPGVQRVLIVATDAPFHLPGAGKPHTNTQASTLAALDAQNIIVVGLKAPGAGGELDALATATGGSVQDLSSNGENIAQAILDGLEEVTTDVWAEFDCDEGLSVSLDPEVRSDVPGNTTVAFTETISVADDLTLEGQILECTVTFIANEYPIEGATIGRQRIKITIPDATPPEVSCVETVNPSGKNIPPAGKTTLPGPKGGQNEDGFYELTAEDMIDPNSEVYVEDTGSGTVFGPFVSGTKIKYTEAPGAVPKQKKIGSDKGKAGAVSWHIIGNGDAAVYAVDLSGNQSDSISCLVPPLPK